MRKPHANFAGYVSERRNPYSGGHTVISDCKRAAAKGTPLVQDYAAEGGRYQVLCNEHGHPIYCTNLPVARECMADPTSVCTLCRAIAGEYERWELEMTAEEADVVRARRLAIRDPRTHPMPGDILRIADTHLNGISENWRVTHVSGNDPETGEGTNGVDIMLADGSGGPHWASFLGYRSWEVVARHAEIIHHAGGLFTIKNVRRARIKSDKVKK